MVCVPADLKVKLERVRVPATKVTFPAVAPLSSAMLALPSELVMVTFGTALATTFQLASTALTTTPLAIAVPAVLPVGAPLLPVAVPGAAGSPASKIWSLATVPALTVKEELMVLVLVGSVLSAAVTVALPAVFMVILKVFVPATNAALAGNVALLSEEVIPTVSLALTRFQLASTALTVTLKAVPAVCAKGVPVLPEGVPGAAVSPGSNNCNFENAAPFTVMEELVFAVLLPSVTSLAVTVRLPVVLSVTLKV